MLGLAENFIWVVGVNQTNQPFFTSENPVVRYGHAEENGGRSFQGVFSPGMEIVFPLTSKLILTLVERHSFAGISSWDNCFIPLTDVENVITIRFKSFRPANRFIAKKTNSN